MTKPSEAVTFALAGAFIVGAIGLFLTAGQESFRIFRFWGFIVGLVVWLLYRAIRYAVRRQKEVP